MQTSHECVWRFFVSFAFSGLYPLFCSTQHPLPLASLHRLTDTPSSCLHVSLDAGAQAVGAIAAGARGVGGAGEGGARLRGCRWRGQEGGDEGRFNDGKECDAAPLLGKEEGGGTDASGIYIKLNR